MHRRFPAAQCCCEVAAASRLAAYRGHSNSRAWPSQFDAHVRGPLTLGWFTAARRVSVKVVAHASVALPYRAREAGLAVGCARPAWARHGPVGLRHVIGRDDACRHPPAAGRVAPGLADPYVGGRGGYGDRPRHHRPRDAAALEGAAISMMCPNSLSGRGLRTRGRSFQFTIRSRVSTIAVQLSTQSLQLRILAGRSRSLPVSSRHVG